MASPRRSVEAALAFSIGTGRPLSCVERPCCVVEDCEIGSRWLGWELSEMGFRGTAGGGLLVVAVAFEDPRESASSKIICRGGGGGGGGGTGFLPTAASAPFFIIVGPGTQSGSASAVNGFDLRRGFAMKPSLGGCIVDFPGAPVSLIRIASGLKHMNWALTVI